MKKLRGGELWRIKKRYPDQSRDKTKVFGVGDAGGNVVKQMIASGLKGIECYAVNTDLEALRTCDGATQVQIGAETTQGLGADANPEIGRRAAEEGLEMLNAMPLRTHVLVVRHSRHGAWNRDRCPLR